VNDCWFSVFHAFLEWQMPLSNARGTTCVFSFCFVRQEGRHVSSYTKGFLFPAPEPCTVAKCAATIYDRLSNELNFAHHVRVVPCQRDGGVSALGCIFLQESSGFLCFPFLWHFFHRNHDSCSAGTFSEPPQESCLYGAYVG
jgi:hypothetical protein